MRAPLQVLIVLLGLLTLPAAGHAQPVDLLRCSFDAQTRTLRLSGPTDQTLLDCVQQQSGGVDTLRINSSGGDVETALSIAEIIADWNAHIIVVRECNSSCANYFLPVAARVTVQPDAVVMLHGSIDAGLVAGIDNADARVLLQQTADRQAAFAVRHSIPPGWLLHRTRYGRGLSGVIGLSVELLGGEPLNRPSRLIVSETLFASCLPDVEIVSFAGATAERAITDGRLRRRLARQGAHVSGSLRCF